VGFGPFGRGRIRLDGERETAMGTFGAMLRLGGELTASPSLNIFHAHAWWMPMEMLWIGMGNEMGALGGLGRQGFYRAGDTVGWLDVRRAGAVAHYTAFSDDFGQGLAVDLRLLDDTVRIGVGLPYRWTGRGGPFNMAPEGGTPPATTAATVESIFSSLFLRAYMDLDGIGRIGVAFDGMGRRSRALDGLTGAAATAGGGSWAYDGDIFAFFNSSELVDGLGLDFSLRFGMSRVGTRNLENGNLEDTENWNNLAIGAGVNFDLDDQISIRFRATAAFDIYDTDHFGYEGQTQLSFELLPSFMITPDVMFGLYAGLGFAISDYSDADMNLQWAVNPHLRINMGAPSFVFGFHAWGNNNGNTFDNDGAMGWAIPMALIFNF